MTARTAPASDFAGQLLTGTQWFERYFDGQRVALLAPGADAATILPEILATAAAVTVFEEAPTWITPVRLPGVVGRLAARAYLRASVPDAWQRRQLTPHRFDSAGVTVSPSYYTAVTDPRTTIVHWPAYAIVERGVRAVDGVEYRFDTIVVSPRSKFLAQLTSDEKRNV